MDRLEPISAYTWDLSHRAGQALSDAFVRHEDPARGTVADLIKPGQIVKTSYGTGPYRVETVKAWPYHGFTGWTLTMAQVVDGVVKGSADYTINELVAVWDEDGPHIRKLMKASNDEVYLLEGEAFPINRAGQLSLF